MITHSVVKRFSVLRRPVLVGFLILLLYFILYTLNILTIPGLKTKDLLLNIKYKLSSKPKYLDKVLVVGINDADYKLLGEKWPWDRNIFASLVYKLDRYKPAVIGFDLGFIGRSPGSADSDLLLAEAFKDAGNVILTSYFDPDGRYVIPLEELRGYAMEYGFTNKPMDKDNVVRKTKIFEKDYISNKILDYSFDFEIFCAFEQIGFSDGVSKIGKDVFEKNIIPINFSAKPPDFTTVSFSDILNNKVQPNLVQDKIVLIGTTAEIFHDIYNTPLERVPSVFIVANTILMLVNKTFIYEVPALVNLLLLVFLTISLNIWMLRTGALRAGTIILATLGILIGTAIVLVLNNILWDISGMMLVLPTAYFVNLLFGYVSLFLQSSRIKKLVITDPLTGLSTRRYLLFTLEAELKKKVDLSLVTFNIDNLETIQSDMGIDGTNSLIKEVGELIMSLSRKTRGIDFISRYGEAKFCVLLHNTSLTGAIAYTERILTAIGKKITPAYAIVMSAGIASRKDIPYNSSKIFVKCAECAVSRAMREGIKKICVYDPKIDEIPPGEYIRGKEISEADLSYVVEELEEKNKELAVLLNKIYTLQQDVIATEKLSSVGKLAATIYHDLNKPIVNLRSGLKVIKEELDRMGQKELSDIKTFVTFATEETKRLEKLCWSLRDLYRRTEKELKEISINSIMDELLNLSFAQLIEKQIKLVKELTPDLPPIIADSGDLKQVFLNLIMNAIESMPKGGELEIRTDKQANMIEVSIQDTGCGIPPENIDKLFKAFFSTKKGEKGSGLGLYVSLEIVKRYGGTIKVKSEVNKGTTFKVYLPFKSNPS